MSMKDYDVVIAGGGMSGLITAASIGHHSKGKARVLVVDRNARLVPDGIVVALEAGQAGADAQTCRDAGEVERLHEIGRAHV